MDEAAGMAFFEGGHDVFAACDVGCQLEVRK